MVFGWVDPNGDFYPRPPRGGRRHRGRDCIHAPHISIHALREEGDQRSYSARISGFYFYPRPPRGGRPAKAQGLSRRIRISIHALREEGDAVVAGGQIQRGDFYPRPPRGGRLFEDGCRDPEELFLSTPSARRATQSIVPYLRQKRFLSTPSARRATAKTETKSLFSYKLYNILHEFRRALIYNGSKSYPNHAK